MPPLLLLDDYLPTEVDIRIEQLARVAQVGVGSAVINANRFWPRTRYRWHIETGGLTRAEIEKIRSFFNYVQGDVPFLFSGSGAGDVQNKTIVGFGDGSTVDFFLMNDRIVNGSVTAYVNGTPTGVTVTNETGMITFSVAPALDALIEAIYECQFRCLVESTGEALAETNRVNLEAYTTLCVVREAPGGA